MFYVTPTSEVSYITMLILRLHIYLSIHQSIHPSICCCSQLEHRAFAKHFVSLQFLISVGRTPCTGIIPVRGCYLHSRTQTQNKRKLPYLARDSNPRSQCSEGRRHFIPQTMRSLWSAISRLENVNKEHWYESYWEESHSDNFGYGIVLRFAALEVMAMRSPIFGNRSLYSLLDDAYRHFGGSCCLQSQDQNAGQARIQQAEWTFCSSDKTLHNATCYDTRKTGLGPVWKWDKQFWYHHLRLSLSFSCTSE
jgi:hypothetical protein